MSHSDVGEHSSGHESGGENSFHARAKRRIASLEGELAALRETSKKQNRRSDTITHRGRAIRRIVSLFTDVEDLVAEYDRRSDFAAEHPGEDPATHCTEEQDQLYSSFEELLIYLPWMKRKILKCDPDGLDAIYKQLRKGADSARGDDTANLKGAVVTWIGELFHPISPPLSPTTKEDRGFVHDATGKLICPAEYNWILDSVKGKIRDRDPSFLVTAHSWPLFLYQNSEFDPTDVEKGLFCSSLMVKAFKYLFTSPSSAKDVEDDRAQQSGTSRRQVSAGLKTATKNHVASIMGLKTVTPRSIAYTAVQLRFALSSVNSWRNTDGDFDYQQFYYNIIAFFEVTPGTLAKKRVDALLAWWTRKVFGKGRPIVLPATTIDKCSVSRLTAQRLGKEDDFA
ncbi:hypothetical protein HYDPIDRAFT_110896 [Hydnomerulius pinastri MD-312]|uniref:Uncharacterized protein n=1 Tax=Hydnomerulius pinastri MD-312 TaxID=994086 RepID=A0A0C9WG87_9AGAM|nr:hypothetical protein HYDPIDRAFT_110896 [Hydnomerulius pinastri MD-312]